MPTNWDEISRQIREREGNQCQWCGAPNGEFIQRVGKGGNWRVVTDAEADALALDGERVTRVVLTVAHLGVDYPDGRKGDKHDKMDCREENLAALCQRCHLYFDLEDHVRHAAETRRRKKILAGQLEFSVG